MDAAYDLVVVGAGSAGLIAAPFARAVGARVLLVEKERIGGDCTWTGCVPSKAFIHTAGIVQCLRQAAAFGAASVAPTVDASSVMDRVHAAIERVYAFETADELARQGIDVAFGPARFVGRDAITIGDSRATGRRFIVCTGAEPLVPPIPGLADIAFLTYKDVFALKTFPRRLLILGSGPIGAEFAQAFRRLGSEVSLVEGADRILPLADPDASAVLADRFVREGVQVYTRSPVERVQQTSDGIALTVGSSRIEGDAVLVAVGRRPRLDALNLKQAGVASTEDGISVDTRLRTGNPRVYAAGDAAGSVQFTHYAGWQGYVAARNALFPGAMRGKRDGVPWVVFTDPEVGQAGMTEEQARSGAGRTEVLRLPLERIDRAQTTGELDGFIKLVARNNILVGATVVAPVAGEVINELALAIQSKATLRQLSSTIHVYPTYGLGIQQLASRATIADFAGGWQGRLLRRLMGR
ncbi:MAG: FAD-dependent oxidoreductase [Candidatus Dormibacter sp.]